MFWRIMRQWRRMAFGAAVWAVAMWAYLPGAMLPDQATRLALKGQGAAAPEIAPLAVGLALVCLVLLVSLLNGLFIAFLPGLRRSVEFGALAVLCLSAVHAFAPGMSALMGLDHGFAPFWFLGIFMAFDLAFGRDFLGRAGLRLRYRSERKRLIRAAPEVIWDAVFPTEPDPDHPNAVEPVIRITPRPDLGKNVQDIHYRMGNAGIYVQRQTREAWTPPHHGAYRFEPADPQAKWWASRGRLSCTIEPMEGGRCAVSLCHDYPSVGIGAWAFFLFDDMIADELDGIQAICQGRVNRSTSAWAQAKMAKV